MVSVVTSRILLTVLLVASMLAAPFAHLDAREPIDSLYPQQRYLSHIYAPQAWEHATDAREIVVAVIDAGVDIYHEDLRNNIWTNPGEIPENGIDDDNNGFIDDVHGWDFINDSPDPRPQFEEEFSSFAMQHGTIVSGIIGARGGNGIGVTGLAWNVKIMPLRALDSSGVGDIVAIARALNYARRNGADIANLSLVGDESSQTLDIELERAYEENMLIVAAAGNEGVDLNKHPRYPVCSRGSQGEKWVLGVTALSLSGKKPLFANYGDTCIDVAAPGTDIFSTQFTTEERPGFTQAYAGKWTGTSVAAPQVTGLAALIKAQHPRIEIDELQRILVESSDSIQDVNPLIPHMLQGGRINAQRAITTTPRLSTTNYRPVIITGAGPGGGPHVRLFNNTGTIRQQLFAYPASETHGVHVASGDVTGNGVADIVTTPHAGAPPLVQVFNNSSQLVTSFMAYHEDMQSGLTAVVYDVDADGNSEIITAPQKGGPALIRIFSHEGVLEREFFAFHAALNNGAHISVADIDQDGLGEIVVTSGTPSSPLVRVYAHHGLLEREFYPFEPDDIRELFVSAHTGLIAIGGGPGSAPTVSVFTDRGIPLHTWSAYAPQFTGGVAVSFVDIDDDGTAEIVTGPQRGGGPHLRIFSISGKLISQWMAYNPGFRGGISVSTVTP